MTPTAEARPRADRRSTSPYGLGSATTGALPKRGEPMATSGEKTCPPVGRFDGRRWGETDGR